MKLRPLRQLLALIIMLCGSRGEGGRVSPGVDAQVTVSGPTSTSGCTRAKKSTLSVFTFPGASHVRIVF